jgi:hypothetical protein
LRGVPLYSGHKSYMYMYHNSFFKKKELDKFFSTGGKYEMQVLMKLVENAISQC